MNRTGRLRRWYRTGALEPLEPRALLTLAPTAQLPDVNVAAGFAVAHVDLNAYFRDPQPSPDLAVFDTNLGTIPVLLTPGTTPRTVANFLNYVNKGAYVNSLVHRSVPGFIWQAGGYQLTPAQQIAAVPADAPVPNEFGASNVRGTVAMAKLGNDPNSATSQFFFNESDTNASNLDQQNGGFTVFGHVLGDAGLAVMDAISAVPVPSPSPFSAPLDSIPLRNYNPGAAVVPANLVLIKNVTAASEFFSVSGDNPGVAAASVQGGTLTVTPLAPGTAHFTVVGYGSDGKAATETFAVNVTTPPSADFVIGSDDQVYTHALDLSGNPSGGYFRVASGAVKDLAAVRLGPGLGSEVFVVGFDDQVYAATVSGTGGRYSATAFGSIASVSAGTDAAGNPLLFAVGTDHQLYEQRFNSAGNPTSASYTKAAFGDFKQTTLAHDAAGNPLLYAVGQDDQVYGLKMGNDGTPAGGLFKVDYGPVRQLVVGHDTTRVPELFVIGTDGGVYAHKLDASGGPSGGYVGVGGAALSITVGTAPNGNPVLFAVGTDHQVYVHKFDPAGNPTGGYAGTASGAAASIAAGPDGGNGPALFAVYAGDNQVYAAPFDPTGSPAGPFTLTAPGAVKKVVVV